jgi:hypothetical protein
MTGTRLTILLLLPLALTVPIHAQDSEPTYKETADWIVRTLKAYGGSQNKLKEEVIKDVQIESCRFSYDSITPHLDKHKKPSGSDTQHVEVALFNVTFVNYFVEDKADPLKPSNARGVYLKTGQEPAVKYGDQTPTNQLFIEVDTLPQALMPDGTVPEEPHTLIPRLIKAFETAVSQCRELYAPTPRPQSPF